MKHGITFYVCYFFFCVLYYYHIHLYLIIGIVNLVDHQAWNKCFYFWSCQVQINKHLSERLRSRGHRTKMNLIIFVESAMAMLNLRDICQQGAALSDSADSLIRLDGVVFGSDDFVADIGWLFSCNKVDVFILFSVYIGHKYLFLCEINVYTMLCLFYS